MAAATYRIGPSDFFTPGDLAADADTLNEQIHALDDALNGNEAAPQDWWDRFQAFMATWKKFYSSTFGSYFADVLASLNDGNRDQLISFENQFAAWAQQAAGYGAGLPGPTIAPSDGSGDTLAKQISKEVGGILPSGVTLVLLVLVIVAIVFRREIGALL
jgi:hypothetical protein